MTKHIFTPALLALAFAAVMFVTCKADRNATVKRSTMTFFCHLSADVDRASHMTQEADIDNDGQLEQISIVASNDPAH